MKSYKFYSDPGRTVTDGNTGLPILKFDEKGEYITLDPVLSKRMAGHFKNKEIELVEKDNEESETSETHEEPVKMYKCKHEGCTFETENKGKIAAHSKTHKEG